jgi:hypothetical protein
MKNNRRDFIRLMAGGASGMIFLLHRGPSRSQAQQPRRFIIDSGQH